MAKRRIGILGGSFNPAHAGHRDISLAAMRLFNLDEVWWMVSPQNPLKGRADMAPFQERIEGAKRAAKHPRILVTGIEQRLGTELTAHSLAKIARRYPQCRFLWIMGADNLADIHRWHDWAKIFTLMPIAVFDRSPYTYKALASIAACRFAQAKMRGSSFRAWSKRKAPAWTFVHYRRNPISATAIRAAKHVRPAAEKNDEAMARQIE